MGEREIGERSHEGERERERQIWGGEGGGTDRQIVGEKR